MFNVYDINKSIFRGTTNKRQKMTNGNNFDEQRDELSDE